MTLVGTPSPGATIRICAPGSSQPLARGHQGELHQTGPGLIEGYIGLDSGDFYIDETGRRWFVTGDQAVMHSDGSVSITGRYKDMIIRGGENIAPAAIEAVLSKSAGIMAQVVGAEDAIAGEVPIGVVHSLAGTSVKSLRDAVLRQMGPAFVPEEILTLEQLQLNDFPKTASGKVQKAQLAAAVREFRQHREFLSAPAKTKFETTLLRAWYKATGISDEHLDQDAPTNVFADSIAVMRVRDTLRKDLGISITTEEMADHSSIKSQIDLLLSKQTQGTESRPVPSVPSPPLLEDLVHTFGGQIEAEQMKLKIEQTIAAKGFDYSDDVGSVIPAHDYMQVLLEAGIIDSWNFAIAVMADGSSVSDFRVALKKTLANSPILTSMCVLDQHSNPHYVTLRPSSKLWDMCIIDHGSVKTAEDVQALALQYPYPEHATLPGPLFRCLVVHVTETNSAAMVMYIHHIVQDASLVRLVYEDLEQALTNPREQLKLHVDFRAWADSFQALRLSPAATNSVNYHVKRLETLHLHKQALYPAARVPRQAIREVPDGLDYGFEAPGLTELKKIHSNIIASTVLKAAMALVDVHRTGYSHALFNNFEAGRDHFPFVPRSTRALNPDAYEASDVNGPVMEGVTNLVEIKRKETALSLLEHMQQEQAELTKHAHAPLRRVIEALNVQAAGSGDMIMETQRTHFLTWIPGFLGDYERLRIAQIAIRCIAGLVVVAGIGGPAATTYMISMRWDVANYSRAETMKYVEDLGKAVIWLTTRENWDASLESLLVTL